MSGMGALRVLGKKDGDGSRNPACSLLAQGPTDTSQRFQSKFEVGSPKLSSAEPFLGLSSCRQAPHPTQSMQPLPLSSTPPSGEEERRVEKALTLHPRAWDFASLYPARKTPMVFWGRK